MKGMAAAEERLKLAFINNLEEIEISSLEVDNKKSYSDLADRGSAPD